MSIIYLYNINNTKGVYMEYVHNYIEQLMAQGKADPKIRGWSMQTIMTQVGDKFGENDLEMIEYHKSIARAYIMSKCGVTDDE